MPNTKITQEDKALPDSKTIKYTSARDGSGPFWTIQGKKYVEGSPISSSRKLFHLVDEKGNSKEYIVKHGSLKELLNELASTPNNLRKCFCLVSPKDKEEAKREDAIGILLQRYEGISFSEYLPSLLTKGTQFKEKSPTDRMEIFIHLLKMLAQAFLALAKLHEAGIDHNNINAESFICTDRNIVLRDFKCARKSKDNSEADLHAMYFKLASPIKEFICDDKRLSKEFTTIISEYSRSIPIKSAKSIGEYLNTQVEQLEQTQIRQNRSVWQSLKNNFNAFFSEAQAPTSPPTQEDTIIASTISLYRSTRIGSS